MINWISELWGRALFGIFIWSGGKLFPYVVIYSPDQEEVIGVTFTTEEKYADVITDMAEEEGW